MIYNAYFMCIIPKIKICETTVNFKKMLRGPGFIHLITGDPAIVKNYAQIWAYFLKEFIEISDFYYLKQ